jgi:hypothetical protein
MDTASDEQESASPGRALSANSDSSAGHHGDTNAAGLRPSVAQRRYLERGLEQPGGKLPLFDRDGREVPRKTVESCIVHGWAEPWSRNPIKPDWLVCRLTAAGYQALGHTAPQRDETA